MMDMVTLRFQTFHPGDMSRPIDGNEHGEIPERMNCEGNAEAAVSDALAAVYDESVWDSEFGLEEVRAEVVVVVSAPPEIAGTYDVELERVTKARARKRP